MNSAYRDELETAVAIYLIRKLGMLLANFKPYDPLYRVIKDDIKKLVSN